MIGGCPGETRVQPFADLVGCVGPASPPLLARRPNWYDAGRFWSGDRLDLAQDAKLSGEIAIRIPPGALAADV